MRIVLYKWHPILRAWYFKVWPSKNREVVYSSRINRQAGMFWHVAHYDLADNFWQSLIRQTRKAIKLLNCVMQILTFERQTAYFLGVFYRCKASKPNSNWRSFEKLNTHVNKCLTSKIFPLCWCFAAIYIFLRGETSLVEHFPPGVIGTSRTGF